MTWLIYGVERASDGWPVAAWLQSFDADAFGGLGDAVFTADPEEALAFDSMADAIAFYRQRSKVRPVRPDGKLNRPLTAFTVSFRQRPVEVTHG